MAPNPLVSVIIPAFNAQEFIGETLNSILAQTYQNLEVIVVDDGSTDRTAEVVRSYHPRVLCHYQANSGGCAVPRNAGIERSSGDYLCFVDADDVIVPDRIARQVDFMERHSSVGLVFCDYRNFNENGLYPRSHFQTCTLLSSQLREQRELTLENPCEILAQENFGSAGSLFIRRAVLKLEAGFEPTLRSCEDFHLYYRLARHSCVGVINEVGMMRRLHGDNMSGNSLTMLMEGIRSRIMLRDSERDLRIRAYLNRYIADCHASLAFCRANSGEYLEALLNDWQALYCHFCLSRVWTAGKGVVRTILMAVGIHIPRTSKS